MCANACHMQKIFFDYSSDFSGCGVVVDLPNGDSDFFDSFDEFQAFVCAEYPDAVLIPLYAEGEDEYGDR